MSTDELEELLLDEELDELEELLLELDEIESMTTLLDDEMTEDGVLLGGWVVEG